MISFLQITVLVCLATLVVAAPANEEGVIQAKPEGVASAKKEVVTEIYSYEKPSELSYDFRYVLSDGTSRFEKGEVIQSKSDKPALHIQGSYSWVSPDGGIYIVSYTADENGFVPIVEGPLESLADRLSGLPPDVYYSLLG